ncbi:hypothetical protein AB4084_31210, partial [Lysobacter sp. 2RAB21]
IAFLDVLGLAFLLVGIGRFVAAGHGDSPVRSGQFSQRLWVDSRVPARLTGPLKVVAFPWRRRYARRS